MIIDLGKLKFLAEKKLITTQRHPSLDLLIHNYTPSCQYSRAWDETTLICRGLITDLEGEIVCRPFPKFFNLEEHQAEGAKLPAINWKADFNCFKKMDGSLGIVYPTPNGPRVATRGSFTGPQAKRANEIFLAKNYGRFLYPAGFTFLFEIIYPENRIVVDYGQMADLVLLDVIDKATGKGCEYGMIRDAAKHIGCPVVPDIFLGDGDGDIRESLAALSSRNIPNEEGVVIRFDDGLRVKVKYAEYKRLHRLVCGVSTRTIWECLSSGKGLEEILDRVPDEFNAWVQETSTDLQSRFDKIKMKAKTSVEWIRDKLGVASRKEYAAEIMKLNGLASIAFQILDGKDPSAAIWKTLEPECAKPFRKDAET